MIVDHNTLDTSYRPYLKGLAIPTTLLFTQRVTVQQGMGLQTSFGVLSEIVEQYESSGRSVRDVEATTNEAKEGILHVTVDVPVSVCSDLTPEAAVLTDEGELQIEFSTSVLDSLPSTGATVSAGNQAVRVTDDGDLLLTVEFTIDPTDDETQHETTSDEQSRTASCHDESQSHSELADDLAAVRDESALPYEDTEYLQRLYDSCDTFTEMSREIQMDVASETVRRYMMEAGIHNPTTYNTAIEEQVNERSSSTTEDADMNTEVKAEMETALATPQSPPATDDPVETIPDEQLVTDGIGLPEGLQIEDIMDAVIDSITVYEVQQHLCLERQRTQELLKQLNLLDLVVRRIADNPEQSVSREEVATRIRKCASNGT
jgi:hypothetical protein